MDFQFYQYGFNFNPKTVKSSEVKQHCEKEQANFQSTIDALYSDSKSRENSLRKWMG